MNHLIVSKYDEDFNYRGFLDAELKKKTEGYKLTFEYKSSDSRAVDRKATLTITTKLIDKSKVVIDHIDHFESEQWHSKNSQADKHACYVACKHYSVSGWAFGSHLPENVVNEELQGNRLVTILLTLS